jgi:hypothetical protein
VDPVELVKLGVLVLGIGWCLYRKLHHALLCFVGISLGSDLVSVDLGPTLTGMQVLGLMFLPMAPRVLGVAMRTPSGRTLLLGLALLAVLMLVYGYLLPWPDKTGERAWSQRSEGRSVVNFSATLSHVSVALYVASCMKMQQYRSRIIGYMLTGTTLASLGVILEVVTQTDYFALLSSKAHEWALTVGGRARGLNGEPRTSGSLAAMGIILLLRPQLRQQPWYVLLLLLHAAAIAFTTSTLGLILLVAGVLTLLAFTRRLDIVVAVSVFGTVTLLVISAWFGSSPFEMWQQYTGERVASREDVFDSRTPVDSFVQSLEIFDASALGFLLHRPEHLLFGTGPGLVSLPASDHVPAGNAQAIFGDRIDSIPHMGLLRVVSDSGLVGLLLWVWNVVALSAALRKVASDNPGDRSWRECRTYFVVFCALFLLQTRPLWYVWLGVGLGAAIVNQERAEKALREARARRQQARKDAAGLGRPVQA